MAGGGPGLTGGTGQWSVSGRAALALGLEALAASDQLGEGRQAKVQGRALKAKAGRCRRTKARVYVQKELYKELPF